jgi:hypothetical protein
MPLPRLSAVLAVVLLLSVGCDGERAEEEARAPMPEHKRPPSVSVERPSVRNPSFEVGQHFAGIQEPFRV